MDAITNKLRAEISTLHNELRTQNALQIASIQYSSKEEINLLVNERQKLLAEDNKAFQEIHSTSGSEQSSEKIEATLDYRKETIDRLEAFDKKHPMIETIDQYINRK